MLCEKPLVRFVLTPITVAVLMMFAATAFAPSDTGKEISVETTKAV